MTPSRTLRVARRKAGLTQAELAKRMGVSQSAVAKLEAPGANPTVETLDRALRATGHQLALHLERESGIDETLIAQALRMTPAQRLASFENFYEEIRPIVGAARPPDE